MGNSDFFESICTANFSEEVFQQPQPIPPAIRTDYRAIYEMACSFITYEVDGRRVPEDQKLLPLQSQFRGLSQQNGEAETKARARKSISFGGPYLTYDKFSYPPTREAMIP